MNHIRIWMELDQRLLRAGMFRFFLGMAEFMHLFLWFFHGVVGGGRTLAISLALFSILEALLLYLALFEFSWGRPRLIYGRTLYFPVRKRDYWISKLILSARLLLAHMCAGCLGGLLAYAFGIW